MLRKLVAALGYACLFLVSTLLFSYFMFPLDKLVEYLEAKANTSSKYRIEIDGVERDGLGRIVLSDVNIGVGKRLLRRPDPAAIPLPSPDAAASPEDEFSYLGIDEVSVDFGLLQLLDPSDVTLGVSMNLLGGTINEGEVGITQEDEKVRIALNLPTIEGLQLGETEFFGAFFSALLPSVKTNRVEGTLETGAVTLEPQSEEESSWYSGRIDVELAEIVAMSPVLAQRMKRTSEVVEVPLTDMRLGRCTFNIRLDRKDRIEELDKVKTRLEDATVVFFEKGECKGESLDYYIKEESFMLLPPKGGLAKGTMDLWTKLAFNPDYFEEERVEDGKPLTRNKELGQGLEFDRMWQQAQDVDGFYWMHCKGTLSKPKCTRGLPAEEKRRKAAQKELEKKKEKEAAKAAKKVRSPSPAESSAAEKRKSAAQERAERLRKEREMRDRPTLRDLRGGTAAEEGAPSAGRPMFGAVGGTGEGTMDGGTETPPETGVPGEGGEVEHGLLPPGEEGGPGFEPAAGEGTPGVEAPAGEEPAPGYETPSGEEGAPGYETPPSEEGAPGYESPPGEAPGEPQDHTPDVTTQPDAGAVGGFVRYP